MSEVKWIKITTDMFEDEKIDFIDGLPEGDAIFKIWIRLLTMAGRCNSNGCIYLTENIPYTADMLAHKFKKNLNVVNLALQTFQKLNMVEMNEQGIYLTNWGKYQSTDKLEQIKEQNRLRQQRYRKNQKLIDAPKEESNKEEIVIDKDIEYRAKALRNNVETNVISNVTQPKTKKDKSNKISYAEFVTFTEDEYSKLIEKYGVDTTLKIIEKLDNYKGANNKKYASDYRAVLNWVADEVVKNIRPKEIEPIVNAGARRIIE